jgi:hypothetical protein
VVGDVCVCVLYVMSPWLKLTYICLHFQTFDNLKYDCQGEGEFSVVKSLDSKFELQGRFIRFDPKRRPTVTQAVAFNTDDGDPIVQVNAPENADNGCSPYMFIDGEPYAMKEESEKVKSITITHKKKKKEEGFYFLYESDLQLEVFAKTSKKNGCVLRAKLCMPDCYERAGETFVGLLGTPDGDKSNDWTGKDGSVFPVKAKSGVDEYNYCVPNWCVQEEEASLFIYDGEKKFDDFNQCDQEPDYETEECVENPPQELAGICGLEGRECLVDGCVAGPEAAEQAVQAKQAQIDQNCGKEIFYENFDDVLEDEDEDLSWAEIAEKAKSNVEGAEMSTNYLLVHQANPEVFRDFQVPKDATLVSVEFLLYEIGGWEEEGEYEDLMTLLIDGAEIDMKFDKNEDESDADGVVDGIVWERHRITKTGSLGFVGDGKDQIHKMTVKIPGEKVSNENINFGFRVEMSGSGDKKSLGIDDLRVIAFKDNCEIDCDGSVVIAEDFNEDDEADWGMVSQLPNGHTILGPLSSEGTPVANDFEISEFADSARVEFSLYEMGDWASYPESRVLVTIGDVQFDLGSLEFDEMPGDVTSGTVGDDDGGIYFERQTKSVSNQTGDIEDYDETIHGVTIDLSNDYISSGFLHVEFSVDSPAGPAELAAGIDDFKIYIYPEPSKCQAAKVVEEKEKEEKKCEDKKNDQDNGDEDDKKKKCYKTTWDKVCAPTAAPSIFTGVPTMISSYVPTTLPTMTTTGTPSPTSSDATPSPTGTDRNLPTTNPPTPKPNPKPTQPPVYTSGDPHIKTWGGACKFFSILTKD